MRYQDIEKDDFAHFKPIEDTFERLNQVNAVKYIGTLASMSGTNIKDWDLLKLFGTGTGRVETNKLKINQTFFKQKEETTKEKPLLKITPAQQDRLKAMEQSIRGGRIKHIRREAERKENSARDHVTTANRYIREAYIFREQLDCLESRKSTLLQDIEKVLENPFWQLHEIGGNSIVFKTTADLVLMEVNPSAGLNYGVNLGKFKAVIEFSRDMFLAVGSLSSGVISRGYPHPHVSSGSVCWGDASARAVEFQSQGRMPELMNLLHLILTTYNPNSPYSSLQSFYNVAPVEKRIGNYEKISLPPQPTPLENDESEEEEEHWEDEPIGEEPF